MLGLTDVVNKIITRSNILNHSTIKQTISSHSVMLFFYEIAWFYLSLLCFQIYLQHGLTKNKHRIQLIRLST